MGEENGYKGVFAEKSSRSLTRQATGKRNGADYLPGFVDNRPSAIAQKKQIDSIYAQPFSPFPEGRADKEPMGLAAVRGNVLQQQAAPLSGRTGGVPVVQRQPFKKFVQAKGLGLEDDANPFFGGNYNHYTKILKVANRIEAFKRIAEVGGAVGNIVTLLNPGTGENEINWGQGAGPQVLNPFVFTPQAKVKNKDTIQISYMYDNKHAGYVIKIEEGDRKGIMKGMVNPHLHGYTVYEPKHAQTGDDNLFHHTQKNPPPPSSYDAYTKLAGEGARFLCVRNHVKDLQDDTLFITGEYKEFIINPLGVIKREPKVRIYGIRFSELWGKWKADFEKKINISDEDVGKKIKEKQYKVEDVVIKEVRDYDLSKHSAVRKNNKMNGLVPSGEFQIF